MIKKSFVGACALGGLLFAATENDSLCSFKKAVASDVTTEVSAVVHAASVGSREKTELDNALEEYDERAHRADKLAARLEKGALASTAILALAPAVSFIAMLALWSCLSNAGKAIDGGDFLLALGGTLTLESMLSLLAGPLCFALALKQRAKARSMREKLQALRETACKRAV